MVIHDSLGRVIATLSQKIKSGHSVEMIEALAAKRAVSFRRLGSVILNLRVTLRSSSKQLPAMNYLIMPMGLSLKMQRLYSHSSSIT